MIQHSRHTWHGALAYVVLGGAVGTWSGSLPSLTDDITASAFTLAMIMVTFRLAGIVTMNIAGPASDRFGSGRIVQLGMGVVGIMWLTGGVFVAFAPSTPGVIGLAALSGAALGVLDVGVNAHAVTLARADRRPLFGFLHAHFAVGALAGSLLLVVTGAATSGSAVRAIATGVVGVALLILAARTPSTPPALVSEADGVPADEVPRGAVLAFLAMGLALGVGEGAAFDWSSFHVRAVGALPDLNPAVGLAAVTFAMMVTRFASDVVIAKVGVRRVVTSCAMLAACGYAVTAMPIGPSAALGWILVGTGVGVLAPQVYGAAGLILGARGVAWSISAGYAGIVAGPVLVTAVAEVAGLSRAMVVPALAMALLAALATRLPNAT